MTVLIALAALALLMLAAYRGYSVILFAPIAALGAVLAHQVADSVRAGLTQLAASNPEAAASLGHDTGNIPDLSTLPAPVRAIFEAAFGDATGHIFLVALPFAVGALVAVLLIKEVPLRTTVLRDDELDPQVAAEVGAGRDEAGSR